MKSGHESQRIVLRRRPDGYPQSEDFGIEQSTLEGPGDGQLLVQNLILSITPGDRLQLNHALQLGDVIRGHTISRILESDSSSEFAAGELVVTRGGWQDVAVVAESDCRTILDVNPISLNLGVLGIPGLTAYAGIREVARVSKGETILVSGVSGTVGSAAAQIAKSLGCMVMGICRNDSRRMPWVSKELALDAVLHEEHVFDDIAKAGVGIDVFFDNVGGPLFDEVLRAIGNFGNKGARVICCGMISQYNRPASVSAYGVSNLHVVINRRLTMNGFIVGDFRDRYHDALVLMGSLLRRGKLQYKEDWTTGLENAPSALCRAMRRDTFGKTLVRIAADSAVP